MIVVAPVHVEPVLAAKTGGVMVVGDATMFVAPRTRPAGCDCCTRIGLRPGLACWARLAGWICGCCGRAACCTRCGCAGLAICAGSRAAGRSCRCCCTGLACCCAGLAACGGPPCRRSSRALAGMVIPTSKTKAAAGNADFMGRSLSYGLATAEAGRSRVPNPSEAAFRPLIRHK